MSEPELLERILEIAAPFVTELENSGIPPENLAVYVPAHRKFLWPRAARMRHVAQVWRLGTLLLSTEGHLYSAGRITRAAERGRPNYQSVSREERRDLAAAALKGGYPAGAAVNFDAALLASPTAAPRPHTHGISPRTDHEKPDPFATSSPLALAGDEIRVLWSPGAPLESAPTLTHYLAERVSLLTDPLMA